MLEVSAAAGAGGLSPLRLLTPVVCSVVSKLPIHDMCSRTRFERKTYISGYQPEDNRMMRILSFECGEHDGLRLKC